MTEVLTSRCAGLGQPEVRLFVDSSAVPEGDVQWMAQVLESMVESGSRFTAGQTLQFGWSLVRFTDEAGGLLGLEEPDFQAMPVAWIPGISNTLRHMRLHKDVVESVHSTEMLDIPSLRDSGIVCSRASVSTDIVMSRHAVQIGDSGWFIGCNDASHPHNTPDELRRVSLYEAIVSIAPQALPYLALPANTTLAIEGGVPRIFFGGRLMPILPGSYLEAALSAPDPSLERPSRG